MKRKGFAPLIIIGIIAVILIVGVAGYFVWKAYVTPNPADLCSPNDSVYTLDGQFVRCATPQTPPCCKTMVIPTSTPSQDTTTTNTATVAQPPSAANTSGWQTYTNQQYGFSFKYPPTWTFDQGGNDGGQEVDGFNIAGQPAVDFGDNVNMYIEPANGKTLSQFASMWEQGSNSGTENLTVGGNQAELYRDVVGRNYTSDSLIIDDGNWFIIFDGNGASYQGDFEQLLPTFQFTQ